MNELRPCPGCQLAPEHQEPCGVCGLHRWCPRCWLCSVCAFEQWLGGLTGNLPDDAQIENICRCWQRLSSQGAILAPAHPHLDAVLLVVLRRQRPARALSP